MTRCIYTVSYFLWLDNFFSYARFFEKFMEQWHKAMPHKAFSDLKNGTEHGTMAQDFKIYGTELCVWQICINKRSSEFRRPFARGWSEFRRPFD